jgi:hypothetical protein
LVTRAKRDAIGWLLIVYYDRLERIAGDMDRAWLMWRIEQAGLNVLVTDTSRIVPIGESGSPDEKLHFEFLSLIAVTSGS